MLSLGVKAGPSYLKRGWFGALLWGVEGQNRPYNRFWLVFEFLGAQAAEAVLVPFQAAAELETELINLFARGRGKPVELFQQFLVFLFKLAHFAVEHGLSVLVLGQF